MRLLTLDDEALCNWRQDVHVFFSMCKVEREQREGSNIFIPTQENFAEDFCEHLNAGIVRLTASGVFYLANMITYYIICSFLLAI